MTSEPTRGRAGVVVVSTQASTDASLDRTGPTIAAWFRERGFSVGEPTIVPDGGAIAETVSAELLADARVVVTTGGTGVTEEIRRRGLAGAGPTALLTRGVAGIAGGRTFVVTLPGSRGGVADGLAVLDGVLDHVLAQLHGEGHAPRSAS